MQLKDTNGCHVFYLSEIERYMGKTVMSYTNSTMKYDVWGLVHNDLG